MAVERVCYASLLNGHNLLVLKSAFLFIRILAFIWNRRPNAPLLQQPHFSYLDYIVSVNSFVFVIPLLFVSANWHILGLPPDPRIEHMTTNLQHP